MERLTTADLRKLVEFFADGYGAHDVDGFAEHVMRALPRLVPCASISYNEMNMRLKRMVWIASPDDSTRFPGCEEIVDQHIGSHPVVVDAFRTGQPRWSRLSDFLTRRELAEAPLYCEFYRRVDVHHQIGIVYPGRDSIAMAIAINRDVRNFSDRERALLNVLVPHLQRAYENAEALTAVKEQLALFHRGIEAAGVGVLVPGRMDDVAFATPQAARWLVDYCSFDPVSRAMPAVVRRWLNAQRRTEEGVPAVLEPLTISRGDRALTVRLVRSEGDTLLLLREAVRSLPRKAFQRYGLTEREVDVLGWVTEGKADLEIAAILGISPRTVQHHLERIYRKLNVETRTAAARFAHEAAADSPADA